MSIQWKNYRFLIVDDVEEFCSTLRGMLKICGAQEIDVSYDGFDALKKIRQSKQKQPYDLILCDYKLSEGKDGLQLLGQIREEKLLKSSGVFIIISSVSGAELVMAAMEYQPDDYIMKPFNQAMLEQRLSRTLKRRLELSPIYYAMENGHTEQAIALCDQIKLIQPKYQQACDKAKADLLLEASRYEEAKAIYVNYLGEKMVSWAAFGLARAQIAEGRMLEAGQTLRDLIEATPIFLKAYDALADLECQLENYSAAKSVLQKAIQISPRLLSRQAKLGQVAYDTGDFETAEGAFREAVRLGRTSATKVPDNYMKLAKSLHKQILLEKDKSQAGNAGLPAKERDKKELLIKKKGEELFSTLKEVRQEFKNDKTTLLDATLLAGKTYAHFSRMPEARSAVDAAYSAFQKIKSDCPEEIKLSMVESLVAVGDKKEAQQLATEFMTETGNNLELNMGLQAALEQSDHNAKGMEAYQRKEFKQAMDLFECALQGNAESVSFNLNYVQSALQAYKEEQIEFSTVWGGKVEACFERIGVLPESDPRFSRFAQLKELFDSIVRHHR